MTDFVACCGHRLVIENELIRMTVLLSKGADIIEFRWKPSDIDVLWHRDPSPTTTTHYRPEAMTGVDAFFDHYGGGWQESLPTGNSWGDFRGAKLGLHGEISLLPWDWEIVEDSPACVEVALSVACRRTPFHLTRRMRVEAGRPSVRIEEEVVNAGGETLPFAWGHHPAFGAPFLEAGCELDLPAGVFRTPPAVDGLRRRFLPGQSSSAPTLKNADGENVELVRTFGPESGTTDNWELTLKDQAYCAIRNGRLDLGFGLSWDPRTFGYLWCWENASGIPNYPFWSTGYLLALEPFNCPIGGLTDEGVERELPRLEPGQRVTTSLAAGFCDARIPFTGEFAT